MKGPLSLVLCLGLVVSGTSVWGQAPPSTDIFLVDVSNTGMNFTFGTPVNITNRDGYDSQPRFLPSGQGILYASHRNGQTDIYRYNLADGSTTQVTHTPESEYSPTITADSLHFSVVRVEADSTQRLWQFKIDGTAPLLLLPDVEAVGYHAWGDEHTVGVFVVGEPHTFQIADIRTGRVRRVDEHIGRSLHKLPRQPAISYVKKMSDTHWSIERYDVPTGEISPLVDTVPGAEDYCWHPRQPMMLMGKGSKVYAWEPSFKEEWKEVADFSGAGIQNITRLAVSPEGTRLALVDSR